MIQWWWKHTNWQLRDAQKDATVDMDCLTLGWCCAGIASIEVCLLWKSCCAGFMMPPSMKQWRLIAGRAEITVYSGDLVAPTLLTLAGNSSRVTVARSSDDDDSTRNHDCEKSRKNHEKLNWPG